MTYEEAIKELEWIHQNGFENDLSIVGTNRILDSIRIAIEALEKQIPKKPKMPHKYIREWECQRCKSYFAQLNDRPRYCCECGQRIDWSEVE